MHVLCNNEDIPKSPYIAQIQPKSNFQPDKVEAHGPGIQENGVCQGKPTEFTVDTRKAGAPAPLEVLVLDGAQKPVEVKVQDNKDGTFKCTYQPKKKEKHVVQVNYGGVAIPKSPFRVGTTYL